jgi:hypothetical protein
MSRKLSTADFAGVASGGGGTVYGDLGEPLDAVAWTVLAGAGGAVSQIEEDTVLVTMTGSTGSQAAAGVFVDGAVDVDAPFTYERRVYNEHTLNNFQGGGLMIRDSAAAAFLAIYIHYNSYTGGLTVRADKWTSPTASTQLAAVAVSVLPEYLRIRDDGENQYFEYSNGGKVWTTLYQTPRTAQIANADQAGAFIQPWYDGGAARNPRVVIRTVPKAQLLPEAANPSRVLLGHVVTTNGQMTVSFADIPEGYEHLEIVADHASTLDNATTVFPLGLRFNGDSGNNYRHTLLGTYASGTGFGNGANDSSSMGMGFNSAGGTAGVPFASTKISIPNYLSTRTKNAVCSGAGWQGNVGLLQGTGSGHWSGTDPISSIDIIDRNGDAFAEGSEFWLYGIRGGEAGGGGGGGDYALIKELDFPDGATIDITDIPEGYKDLIVVWDGKITGSAANDTVFMRFNENSEAIYDFEIDSRFEYVTGFSQTKGLATYVSNTGYDAEQSHFEMTIFSYTKPVSKVWRTENYGLGGGNYFSRHVNGRWKKTDPITSIHLYIESANTFLAGSVQVYGRGKA